MSLAVKFSSLRGIPENFWMLCSPRKLAKAVLSLIKCTIKHLRFLRQCGLINYLSNPIPWISQLFWIHGRSELQRLSTILTDELIRLSTEWADINSYGIMLMRGRTLNRNTNRDSQWDTDPEEFAAEQNDIPVSATSQIKLLPSTLPNWNFVRPEEW